MNEAQQDTQDVSRIESLVSQLNGEIRKATNSGLRVEVTADNEYFIGKPHPVPRVTATVYRQVKGGG